MRLFLSFFFSTFWTKCIAIWWMRSRGPYQYGTPLKLNAHTHKNTCTGNEYNTCTIEFHVNVHCLVLRIDYTLNSRIRNDIPISNYGMHDDRCLSSAPISKQCCNIWTSICVFFYGKSQRIIYFVRIGKIGENKGIFIWS